ncbi:MAG: HD domain-containing protein [Bacilli bacterium]
MIDENYNILIEDILQNKEFTKLENIEHHGTSRLKHSKRVSYYSYKICKNLHIDYISAARAGLLHDFFISPQERNKKERIKSVFTHPKKALETANTYFELNDIEQNIIISHMFPLYITLPQYLESWIVSIVDKVVGSYEFLEKLSLKHIYVPNVFLLTLIKIFN